MFQNKFGMFIHWGIYSLLEEHEQVLARKNLDNSEYEKLKDRFNPTEFDPESIVSLAKRAGMEYICFTAKHHDGFCMYDTKYTDYNIMNTPYGKDILGMLAKECEKQGMLFSIYYSNPDWHNENGYNANSSHQWKAKNRDGADNEAYRRFIKDQITELLTNYGRIYTLFWDIPPKVYDPSINELVRKLQPGILINDRGHDTGDFSTPERDFSSLEGSARFTRMTEACNSVGEQSWGYRRREDYHTFSYLASSVDRIMAMGGSYLLNIGPRPDGTVDKKSRELIERVGRWYTSLGGCIKETTEEKLGLSVVGNKFVVNRKNGRTYFHFYDGLSSSAVSITGFPGLPSSVRLVNRDIPLCFEIEKMPAFYYIPETGQATHDYLHIYDIPADEMTGEPIVIEIEW